MGNNKITKGFISCNEAADICDRSQYKEATLWERVKLELHIFWCVKCNEYVKSNAVLSKLLKKYTKDSCPHRLSKDKKIALEKLIEKEHLE